MTTTWHVWYTDERVVTLLAEHTILLPGRCPHINFHVCVLHLKNIHTISSLQNLLGIPSSSATSLLCNNELSVCIMVVTRAGAIMAAAKAVSMSCEYEKRRKSVARKCKWRECQSAEQQTEILQTNWTRHAEGRAYLSDEQ